MLAVAHRMPASASAAAELATAGAGVFEVDLLLTSAGIVLSHDLRVHPLAGHLRRDGARFSWGREATGEPLSAAVERLPAGARLLLDLKDDQDDTAFALVRSVLAAGLDPGRVMASSKHWPSLEMLAAAGFPVWATVGDRNTLRWVLRGVGPERPGPEGSGLTVRHSYLTRERVAPLKRHGLLTAWTVNDVARARELAAWGVDGVTTDRPEVMRAVRALTA